MRRSTAIFLILLRLAIGWHFLAEGWQKVQSHRIGETVTNRPFSSAGYFREAPGPLGKAVRYYAGDPDGDALARLLVSPIPEGKDPATYPPQDRVPFGLKKDWESYLRQFKSAYELDEAQAEQADKILAQTEAKIVELLTYQAPATQAERDRDERYALLTTEQTQSYASGEVKRRMSLSERIEQYRGKLKEVQAAQDRNWAFNKDVEGAQMRQLKSEAGRLRSGLLADIDKQTQTFKQELDKVLTAEQSQEKALAESRPRTLIDVLDWITPYFLTGIGACLLVGLFTRTSAFLGAGFLLMTYLAVPAFPWLPSPPQSEGNYLFVNKNVVEMLALCVLATTATGRWFGLDAIPSLIWSLITGKKPNN